jgi:hypothetical protein
MRQIALVVVAVMVVVLIGSCSCKAKLGNVEEEPGKAPAAKAGGPAPVEAPPAATEGGPKAVVIEVGDERDEAKGEITKQTRDFTADTKVIYVDVGVKGLTKGAKVKGTLKCVEATTKDGTVVKDIEVASTELDAPGEESTFNFKFSAPTKGWPVGKYVVEVATGGKAFETIDLTVK